MAIIILKLNGLFLFIKVNPLLKITPELKPKEQSLDLKYINKMLGLELKESELKAWSPKTGVRSQKKDQL